MEEFEAMEQAGIRQIHENFREGTPGTYIVHPDHQFSGGWNHKGEGKRLDNLLNIFRNVETDEINLVEKFADSVFGDFIKAHKHRERFGGVVFRHLGFHMIYPDMPDELHFRFISRSARTCVFGRREFASVTGLRFGNIEIPVGNTSMVFGSGCCLEGRKKLSVSVKDVTNALNFHSTRRGVDNAEVLYRLGLVYFIYGYVLGWNENKVIPREIFYIVEDLDLVARFAWGEYLWRITYDKIGHLMATVKRMSVTPPPPKSDHKPTVEGWAPVLVYWAYDLFPRLQETELPFCKRLSHDAIPRMLRWECSSNTPRGPTMKTSTVPEVGMIDHLVFGADEIAKLIELGLSHDEVTAHKYVSFINTFEVTRSVIRRTSYVDI